MLRESSPRHSGLSGESHLRLPERGQLLLWLQCPMVTSCVTSSLSSYCEGDSGARI